jgi:DNA-binding NarL/FixJ family response regulator
VSLAERVQTICRGATDSRDLRRSVLDAVRREIGYDAYAWLLTDPETCVGSSPLAEVPCPDELPEIIRAKYLSPTNRWTTLAPGRAASLARPGAGEQGAGEPGWRELLGRYGVRDVASVVFRDRSGCWGFLDLWRSSGTFQEPELALLGSALAPVVEALRRCQAPMFATPAAPSGTSEPPEPAVLLLSPSLRVRTQTEAAEGHLRALLPTAEDRRPVPATAYNVAAQLLAREAGVDDHPPSTRVALGAGQWWTFRAARLGPGDLSGDQQPDQQADLAVTIERTGPRERLGLFCRAHDLTERESAVLRCLADGEDTRAVAARLHLSEFTVQDHLKSVFAKTGVRSRRVLLARAAGLEA